MPAFERVKKIHSSDRAAAVMGSWETVNFLQNSFAS
jgi:hypothetical protein